MGLILLAAFLGAVVLAAALLLVAPSLRRLLARERDEPAPFRPEPRQGSRGGAPPSP